jgi:hypothetical protein
MVQFNFTVNRSFLNPKRHPITIQKSEYSKLQKELFPRENATVICHDGSRMYGYIYRSYAGWGPYYQLVVRGENIDPLSLFQIDKKLIVTIEKKSIGIEVFLSDA